MAKEKDVLSGGICVPTVVSRICLSRTRRDSERLACLSFVAVVVIVDAEPPLHWLCLFFISGCHAILSTKTAMPPYHPKHLELELASADTYRYFNFASFHLVGLHGMILLLPWGKRSIRSILRIKIMWWIIFHACWEELVHPSFMSGDSGVIAIFTSAWKLAQFSAFPGTWWICGIVKQSKRSPAMHIRNKGPPLCEQLWFSTKEHQTKTNGYNMLERGKRLLARHSNYGTLSNSTGLYFSFLSFFPQKEIWNTFLACTWSVCCPHSLLRRLQRNLKAMARNQKAPKWLEFFSW